MSCHVMSCTWHAQMRPKNRRKGKEAGGPYVPRGTPGIPNRQRRNPNSEKIRLLQDMETPTPRQPRAPAQGLEAALRRALPRGLGQLLAPLALRLTQSIARDALHYWPGIYAAGKAIMTS